ncbi:hypothetical protein B0H34DRAFT_131326 [Crassisporium funariophilum]|nr:hypothetical protein B0H34DRAFT_131326 [Crassisporium funariophilum]
MANQKPLPALPSPALTTLSVEARIHRALLIRHFLADIHEPSIESRRDGWLYVFEEALDELSQHMNRGEWLNSVRRGRTFKQIHSKKSQANGGSLGSKAGETGEEKKDNGKGPEQKKDTHHLPSPVDSLKQVRHLAARAPPPSGVLRTGHLVLCVAPHGSKVPVPIEDSGFDIVPANIGCTFSAGDFALQGQGQDEFDTTVMYGLNGLETNVEEDNLRLVGGTFTFKGVNSPIQHHLLFKVLRLSVYLHLSLILEQHLNSDSGVQLKYSRPKMSTPSPSTPIQMFPEPQPRDTKTRSRNSIIPSSFTNFFAKRSLSFRSQTISPPGGRGGSLDLTHLAPPENSGDSSPRKSSEGVGLRLRRFSFIGDRRKSTYHQSTTIPKRETEKPFAIALKRINESIGLLSTSPGVVLKAPKTIIDLAEKETANQGRRLKGDERVGLTSLLGWDGKDAEGRGMSGILGFVRHQGISVLYSQYVSPRISAEPGSGGSSTFTRTSSTSNLPKTGLSTCCKPHWVTYNYYSAEDRTLGDAIHEIVMSSKTVCDRPGCTINRGQHERRYIHAGLSITIQTSDVELDGDGDDFIQMWESCAICEAKSPQTKMNDGTFLHSFAKFLELLIYSPALCTLTPSLCEHTTPPTGPWSTLPVSRLNIVRHFSTASSDVSFALSTIEDIFELRVPRLQITRGVEKSSPPPTSAGSKEERTPLEELASKRILRREIKKWWEGVADHVDKIEKALNSNDMSSAQKALPRLPSVDDAYDDFDFSRASTGSNTPRAQSPDNLPPLPPTTPSSPTLQPIKEYFPTTTVSNISTETAASQTPTVPPKDDADQLLATLRHNFHKVEQSLYSQLARTPEDSLNDVRRAFLSTGRGTQKRLKAWQKKHLGRKARLVGDLVAEEPAWWGKGCHAVPGGNIIVRENDWGSIIAHTLSTVDYQLELANLSMVRSASGHSSTAPLTPATESAPSSFFSVATGYRLFTSGSRNQPDPDQEGVVWNEPEQYSGVISRKEHTRDGILSIRDVLRQNTIPDTSSTPPLSASSRFATISSSSSHSAGGSLAAAAVKAKADVGVTRQAADGEVKGPAVSESADKLLQELESNSSRPGSVRSENISSTSSGFLDAHIRRGSASSIISGETGESEVTLGKKDSTPRPSVLPPPLPPKDLPKRAEETVDVAKTPATPLKTTGPEPVPGVSSGFASTLASGVSAAMRFVISSETPSNPVSPSATFATSRHHGLLLADIASDERPHIKYDWTIGKRLKFSCTVYYAKQFDVLRKRCGINDIFLKSLSRSTNWAAEGGKSKSNFWKTSDDRFIIKTLVNAWNVADLQVLIEHAPSYFRYMDATASKATVLAKLIGFYTIEIRNLETGTVQSKADLLVMENLFYDQNITKMFDLKGIQGRKVKAHGNTSKTLFDGEWIEGQQRTLTLVHPHSKAILHDALKSDAEFLARSNIMDYSLLLGVDEEKKQIACGLVDTIGSYTFAKTLEYKAKQNLQSGKEVTVIPPAEYQERFISALEGYFVACPDKWSKPQDESKIISDLNLLPSVL